MILKKELRVLHLDVYPAKAIVYYTEYSLSIEDLKACTPSPVTHFYQQSHTFE